MSCSGEGSRNEWLISLPHRSALAFVRLLDLLGKTFRAQRVVADR